MKDIRTKSIRNIEEKLGNFDSDSMRHNVLESAKNFKTSWVDLGQAIYSVWKDKLYKDWGYAKFDVYTAKEIGIRKQTALKLLRSYYFLEKEEPLQLNKEYNERKDTASVPTYESVDVLRLAKAKKILDKEDYANIRKNVLEKGRDARDVRKAVTSMIRQREALEPEEARKKRRLTLLKRFISLLKSIREEIRISKLLPVQIAKDADRLIDKLNSEL